MQQFLSHDQKIITDDGTFVNRKEAAKIAYKAKQIDKKVTVLFSEDLTGDWPWKVKDK